MKKILIIGLLVTLLTGCLPEPGSSGLSEQDQIGTLVAATLTAAPTGKYLPVQTEQPAVATSAPGDTQQPPSATLEPTLTPSLTPSLTPTFTATVTLTPTLVPGDPVLSLGFPTFDDRFNGTTNFYQYDGTSASYQIEQDQMVLIAK